MNILTNHSNDAGLCFGQRRGYHSGMPDCRAADVYSFLGPAGTFSEAALQQVPSAVGKTWRAVGNVSEALEDVTAGRSGSAMIPIESSVDGGVGATQDALAELADVRIIGEYLVPVNFTLVAAPGRSSRGAQTVAAHPVAYAQTRRWLAKHLPGHVHVPAASNVAAATGLLDSPPLADVAVSTPTITEHAAVQVLAGAIADNAEAVTRFVLVSRDALIPAPTGADQTSVVVELPNDHPGGLVEMLEQFATRGINLGLLSSRPLGVGLGRYRFVIDCDGHISDARVADALLGLRRFSPRVTFLGSYPRADQKPNPIVDRFSDESFTAATAWLEQIRRDVHNPAQR